MRTDRELQHDVAAELDWEAAVDARAIGIDVEDGIVTLSGEVDSYAQKQAAEAAAQRIAGVRGVVVAIDVALPGTHRRQDADLAQAVRRALDWSAAVPKDAIHIAVQDGYVTLSGEVDRAHQRWAALDAVRDIVGVVDVYDRVVVKPSIATENLKSGIEAALHRHAQTEAANIVVEIEGGNVTLSGSVDSFAERNAARVAAWAAPGVKNVVDNLRVGG